jgi:nucleotide-binding universal stress UspA family protein
VQVSRVVVGVSGSAGSLIALRYAADLARSQDAMLAPVLAWTPPGGELADRRYPSAELRRLWVQRAWDRLWQAMELAFGGPPADIELGPEVVLGQPGPVLALNARRPGDVLVVGAGRHGALRRMLSCRVARYCVSHGGCPVITVPPAQLADVAHGLRSWMERHRLQPEDAVSDVG